MKKLLEQVLLVVVLLFALMVHSAKAGLSLEDLTLVQINLNGKLNYNSEILQLDGKLYLPVKQIGEIVEDQVKVDRINKIATLVSRHDNLPVNINAINQTITIGDNTLDSTNNLLLWVQQGFALRDDILISSAMLESFYDVKITFDEENSVVNLRVFRPLKSLKQERSFQDDELGDVVKPKQQNLSIRSLQMNVSSLSNSVSQSNGTTATPFTFGNQIGINMRGDAFGGIYRIGPTLYQQNTLIGLSGFQQSWSKLLNEHKGLVLGDSIIQFDPLNFPSSNILGFRMGTPQELNLKAFDGLTFAGKCESNSEILLLFNNQVIARQICRDGKYNLINVPRLAGTSNNTYQVVQNNTDGTQITLRESLIPYYDGLIPAKEKRWQVFAGRPSFTSNLLLTGAQNEGFDSQEGGNKAVAGAYYKYGLTPKVNVQAAISADRLISNSKNFDSLYGNSRITPLFSDPRFLQGSTASVGITSRLRDNLGISLFGAVSQSSDNSPVKLFRAGSGLALFSNYDYRFKNFYTQGSLYYYSPNFYSPLNIFSNRRGANISLGFNLKKHSFSSNIRLDDTNLDGKSFGGMLSSKSFLLAHNYTLSKNTSVSSFVNAVRNTSDLFDQDTVTARTLVRQHINKRLDATLSTGIVRQIDRKVDVNPFTLTDFTPGATVYFGKNRKHQMNFGSSFYSDGTQSQFVQGRLKLGKLENLVYQPSITRFRSLNGDVNWLVSNGLFIEKQNGLRLGGEYVFGRAQSSSLSGRSTGQVTQALRLTMFCNVGFADRKPYIVTTMDSGYVKGDVFIDTNANGVKDAGEISIKDAQIIFRDKPLKVNADGSFTLRDIPKGIYEAYLDPLSLPIALVPVNQAFRFQVEAGRLTELHFTAQLNAGSVSGMVLIKDVNGKAQPSENIVVTATNSSGKEVAYTYVERSGYYNISELPPGEYTISIDKVDLERRNLSTDQAVQKITIPVKFDELVEVPDVNFNVLQSTL